MTIQQNENYSNLIKFSPKGKRGIKYKAIK